MFLEVCCSELFLKFVNTKLLKIGIKEKKEKYPGNQCKLMQLWQKSRNRPLVLTLAHLPCFDMNFPSKFIRVTFAHFRATTTSYNFKKTYEKISEISSKKLILIPRTAYSP